MFRLARTLSMATAGMVTGIALLVIPLGAEAGAQPESAPPAGSRVLAAAESAALAAAAVPPSNVESVYTSVAPCRIVDTRVAGGKIAAGGTRNLRVTGSTGFPAQGGTTGGCGIPAGATAVMASFKSVESTAVGYLRAWPYGGSAPTATTLTYPALAIGDGVAVPLGTSSTAQLTVRAFQAATHLTIDVVGYYAPQIHARVTGAGVLDWSTNRILSASRLQTGIFVITVDRQLTGCAATASAHGGSAIFTSVGITGSSVIVYLWHANGTPVDAYFYLTVAC